MEWQETQNSVELVLCSTVTVTPSAAIPSRAPSSRSQNQVFLNSFPSMVTVSFEFGYYQYSSSLRILRVDLGHGFNFDI